MITTKIDTAIARMLELHATQTRKGAAQTPYAVHPIHVGLLASRYTDRWELVVAALLHDTVEDTPYTPADVEREFGTTVRELVGFLTEDKAIADWQERKDEHLARVRTNPDACLIKAADVIANLRSLRAGLDQEGPAFWQRFNAPKDEKIAHEHAIFEAIHRSIPSKMAEEYRVALAALG